MLSATAVLPTHDRGRNLFWDATSEYPSVPLDEDGFHTGDFVLVECRVVRKRLYQSSIVYQFRLASLTLIAPL